MVNDRKKQIFNLLKYLIFLLSIILFFALLNHIGFDYIAESFVNIGFYGIAILVFLGLLENVLDSASLKYSSPKKIKLWKIHAINSAGGIINSVFPWELGEVAKGALIKKDSTLNDSVLVVVLYNYIFKLSKPVIILLTIIVALISGVDVDSYLIIVLLIASFISFIPFFFIIFVLRYSMASRIIKKVFGYFGKDHYLFLKKIYDFEKTVKFFRKERKGDFYRVLFLQLFARTVSLTVFLTVAYFLETPYAFGILCLANAGINLTNYITMLIPAKLGISESTSFLIFSMLGLDGGAGILIAVILRIKALFTQAVSCILLLFV